MGQLKANTFMEKHGFLDPDKKKPSHDKIQIWTYNNADKILNELFPNENISLPYQVLLWEDPIVQENRNFKQLIGFTDLLYYQVDEQNGIERFTYFEIKTKIESLGELIRQLKFYKTYCKHNAKFIVVSPDNEYEQILKEQGFHYVQPHQA